MGDGLKIHLYFSKGTSGDRKITCVTILNQSRSWGSYKHKFERLLSKSWRYFVGDVL